ncbi:uncharacterized protein LOC116347959 [Contarinia nasturtii]|uniref:uncharacterized protein LOC116347959 n=1 Tax=Contarinia nasturtii TaxID=265458 RepID=UPI0012D3B3AF|nr:uncharacterized protein LOC116347959 [Contarinia nasturtii]
MGGGLKVFYMYCHTTSVVDMVHITYVVMIYQLCERFEMLDTILLKHFTSGGNSAISPQRRQMERIRIIKFIGSQHDKLTEIMEMINRCYSLQVMVYIGVAFVYYILVFLAIYKYLGGHSEMDRLSFNLICTFYYAPITILVIYSGSLIARKGKAILKGLHDNINTCNDSDVAAELTYVSQQIAYQHPVATCGLFHFDWPLFYNIIAAIATYVTLLIQFERMK